MNLQAKDPQKAVEIFLVDDNPTDVFLLREALRQNHTQIHLEVAYDGEEALSYLRKEGSHAGSHEPDLILLDLNLPQRNGWEILAEMRENQQLRHIPILVWSGVTDPATAGLAYRLNANGFIVKPADFMHYRMLASYLQDFWIDHFQNS